MKYRNYTLFGIALLLGLAAIFATRVLGQSYIFKGSLLEPPLPAEDFALKDQHGQSFRLSDHHGEVVLIFFGYTNCPDVCPVTLAGFRQIKERLADKADRARFVFVTVDPERDTPERIAEHLANFDPAFIGLTGEPDELQTVWKNYGVYAEKAEASSASGYLVDHTARVYVIDVNGNLRLTYAFGTDNLAMAQDVDHLLDEEAGSND
jgi:protein SCO1/2